MDKMATTRSINDAWNRSTSNWQDRINNSELTEQEKAQLLIKLTEKRKTMLIGGLQLSGIDKTQKQNLPFNIDKELSILKNAKNSTMFRVVEDNLQEQINTIRKMNDIPPEKKSLYLFTLQNMIFGLSDWKFENGQKNDFMPKILQDQYQMLLKGSTMGLDWDRLYNSVYTNQYRDVSSDALAEWQFLDYDKIQSNMEDMMHSKSTGKEMVKENSVAQLPDEYAGWKIVNGKIDWGNTELTQTPPEKINRIVVDAMDRFNVDDLQNQLPQFFNFVKGEMEAASPNQEKIYYQDLHKIVLSALRKFVELGNDYQKYAAFKKSVTQDETAGRNL